MTFETKQEAFWAGSFGDDYTDRQESARWIANNTALFAEALSRTRDVNSVVEFGANVGLNLMAIRTLLPEAELAGVEINPKAFARLNALAGVRAIQASILEYEPDTRWDLALIKGVLIHINPEHLPRVYDLIHAASSRYICITEYYSPKPEEVKYRGHDGVLFKRDFAGEMLDRFEDLCLVDYGFVYHRGRFPQDDVTWFLLEKSDGETVRSVGLQGKKRPEKK